MGWIIFVGVLVAFGIVLFWNECRGGDIQWKTIIPFTVGVILLFVVTLIITK